MTELQMKSAREGLKSVVASQTWLMPVFKTIGKARCRAWDIDIYRHRSS
jgi:hypothetical protein